MQFFQHLNLASCASHIPMDLALLNQHVVYRQVAFLRADVQVLVLLLQLRYLLSDLEIKGLYLVDCGFEIYEYLV